MFSENHILSLQSPHLFAAMSWQSGIHVPSQVQSSRKAGTTQGHSSDLLSLWCVGRGSLWLQVEWMCTVCAHMWRRDNAEACGRRQGCHRCCPGTAVVAQFPAAPGAEALGPCSAQALRSLSHFPRASFGCARVSSCLHLSLSWAASGHRKPLCLWPGGAGSAWKRLPPPA